MRGRTVSFVLLGLGAFALVAALAVRLVLAPSLVKLPLDQSAYPEADGTGITMFDFGTMSEVDGVTGTVYQTVEGQPGHPDADDDTAVWNFGSVIEDDEGTILNEGSYRACIDRGTAESAPDCSAAFVDKYPEARIEGLTLTFPFHTEQRDYELFNLSAAASFTAEFVAVEEIDGLEVYRFEQTIPETVVREEEIPGAMAGEPDETSVAGEFVYSNVRTLWVEPTSGVIVTAEERPVTVLRGPAGNTGVTWLSGTFTATAETTREGVERAEDTRSQIVLIETTVPLSLAGLGVLLVIGGVLVGRRAGAGDTDRPAAGASARQPVPVS
ncbi:DUF3068 domain-containing protein [Blastococcus jejuensis]|uniref:DUF3068 domain-containing protein n=1 Tax=Blastococcus jejuensis TaxID=351224 RepID=A0ABP6P003_9ACTN